MFIYLLIIGFISILGQVLILRELNVAFFGIELIYIISLGFWLLGTAIGSLTGKRKFFLNLTQLKFLFLIWGILFFADVIFIRSIRLIFLGMPGAYLPFYIQLIAIIISILPISILVGVLFQQTAKIFVAENKTLAKAYAIESAGGILGGIASTLFLIFGIQNFESILLCGLITFSFILFHKRKENKSAISFVASLFIIISIAALVFPSPLDFLMTKQNHPNLVEVKDTPYSRITVTSLEGQISVFENDALSFETESTSAEEFVHLTLMHHQQPSKVLVLGGGMEGIIYELSKYKPEKIDYVELNEKLIDITRKYLPEDFKRSITNSNVRIIIDDPRIFLNTCLEYDVILIGMPEPSSGLTNRFYTKEFFEKCFAKLNDKGIIALRLRSSENLWTLQLTKRNASIYRALKSVFPNVIILPGTTNIIIGSYDKLETNDKILAERLTARKLNTKLVSPQYVHYIYTNDRFIQISDLLSKENAPINTDVKPICYQYTTSIWLSKFFPDFIQTDLSDFTRSLSKNYFAMTLMLIIISIIFIAGRFWIILRRWLLVFLAGFIGMITETMLILNYQTNSGILYQNIGILLTAFMAGLTIGSFSVDKFYHLKNKSRFTDYALGIFLIGSIALLNFSFEFLIKRNLVTDLSITSFILFLTGFLVAGIFAYSSFLKVKDQLKVISPLYSADLLGGSAGSIAASLFLIPMLGLLTTGNVIGILSILSLILI
ncbi:MAG: hypothetical protein M1480_14880 [Bacteroidetes bacterium]|nr:hypothetical protein [Bacteroidota bacterium]